MPFDFPWDMSRLVSSWVSHALPLNASSFAFSWFEGHFLLLFYLRSFTANFFVKSTFIVWWKTTKFKSSPRIILGIHKHVLYSCQLIVLFDIFLCVKIMNVDALLLLALHQRCAALTNVSWVGIELKNDELQLSAGHF